MAIHFNLRYFDKFWLNNFRTNTDQSFQKRNQNHEVRHQNHDIVIFRAPFIVDCFQNLVWKLLVRN